MIISLIGIWFKSSNDVHYGSQRSYSFANRENSSSWISNVSYIEDYDLDQRFKLVEKYPYEWWGY